VLTGVQYRHVESRKGNAMERTDAAVFFRHAREEMLLALDSTDVREERRHRRIADDYITRAVKQIRHEPEREHDWGELCP
jgi:hypothetical protein